MHSVDRKTEQMIRSVLAYAENRLRLDPVPLDRGSRRVEDLEAVFGGLLGPTGTDPDQVLGIYTSAIAPAVISADSPRFLGFIPSAPTKAALLFDMLMLSDGLIVSMRDLLDRTGATGYTIINNISGKGHHGFHEGHLLFNDTSSQVMVFTVVPENKVEPILAGLGPLFNRHSGAMFVTDVAVSRRDHFAPK